MHHIGITTISRNCTRASAMSDRIEALRLDVWQTISDYPNYEASSEGDIRNRLNGHVLKPNKHRNGYHTIQLRYQGHRMFIHRIVALTFLGAPPTPKHQVNHKDGNKTNNHISNLEWATVSENILHAFALGINASWRKKLTHCTNGHEYTPENTRITRQGKHTYRRCLQCERLWLRIHRPSKRKLRTLLERDGGEK